MGDLLNQYENEIGKDAYSERKREKRGVFFSLGGVFKSEISNNFSSLPEEIIRDSEKIALDIANYSGQEDPITILGKTMPQPKIGAVLLTQEGTVYCSSRSGRKIGDHAESTVINEAARKGCDLSKSVLFSTLEPCTKFSRHEWTESCSEIVVSCKIPLVFFGSLDANPNISGIGIKRLMESGIVVRSFEKDLAAEARNQNEDFFKSFDEMIDPKTMRDIVLAIKPLVDEEAVKAYIHGKENKPSHVSDDEWFSFFKEMVLRSAIKKGCILKFEAEPEFALAFYKNPEYVVPGFDVSIYNLCKEEKGMGVKRQTNKVTDFVPKCLLRMLNEDTNFFKDKSNVYKTIQDIVSKDTKNDKFILFGENVFANFETARELLVNAFVHSDYSQKTGIVIEISPESITIKNPIKDIGILDLMNKRTMPSYPPNPMLMDFFYRAGIVEKQHQGMNSVKEASGDYGDGSMPFDKSTIGNKIVLQTRIPLKTK